MAKKKIRASNVARRLGAEARTERNKKARMKRHAKCYPPKSSVPTSERRAMGRAWKAEAQRRAESGGARAS